MAFLGMSSHIFAPNPSPVPEQKKLVFIQKTAGRGGAKSRLLDTLTALREGTACGLHVVTSEKGEFTERCAQLEVPVTIHPLPEWRKFMGRLRFPGAMKALARKLPFDQAAWVISNEMWWAPHAGTLARYLGGRSAVILRDGIADAVKARKYRLQDNDIILPLSQKIARGLEGDAGLKERSRLFFDAVLLPPSNQESAALLQAKMAGTSPEVKRWLLVIGRVQARKKQADAVRVLRALMDRGHRDFGLLVAGDCDPDYESEMQSAMHKCQVQDRVVMLGNFADIRALFSLAEVCLLTSLREALPGSVIESFLAGRPCFMYPCEGAEDIFGPYQDLFVSSDFKPDLLADKMDTLLRNPIRLSAETLALQQRVGSLFSLEAHLRSLAGYLGLELKSASTNA